MDLVAKTKSGSKTQETIFEDKEFFLSAVSKAYDRRLARNHVEDADKIVKLFAFGATIAKKDLGKLKRALRRYDEVYLCNELFDLLEECECDYITLGEDFGVPTDLSGYNV